MEDEANIDIDLLLGSQLYSECCNSLKKYGAKILDIRASDSVRSQRDVDVSCFSVSDVKLLLESKKDELLKYFLIKDSLIISDQEEEFPKGEEQADDEESEVIEDLGFSYSALVLCAIEFLYLDKSPVEINSWLKARRVPKAKAYIKEIRSYYEKALLRGEVM